MRKYIYSGAVIIAATIVGYTGFLNSAVGSVNGTKDEALNQMAIEYVKSDEHIAGKVTNIEVHLTEDREGAIIEYNQGGQEMMAMVLFEEYTTLIQ